MRLRTPAAAAVLLAVLVGAGSAAADNRQISRAEASALGLNGKRVSFVDGPAGTGTRGAIVDATSGRTVKTFALTPGLNADAVFSGSRVGTIAAIEIAPTTQPVRTTLTIKTPGGATAVRDTPRRLTVWDRLLGNGGVFAGERAKMITPAGWPGCGTRGTCELKRGATTIVSFTGAGLAAHVITTGGALGDADRSGIAVLKGSSASVYPASGGAARRYAVGANKKLRLAGDLLLVADQASLGNQTLRAIRRSTGKTAWTREIRIEPGSSPEIRSGPEAGGGLVVWASGSSVRAIRAGAPDEAIVVGRCDNDVNSLAVGTAGIAWACAQPTAGVWFAGRSDVLSRFG